MSPSVYIIYGDWICNTLPDKSQNIIICDPPYYKVKGEFDFIWKSMEDYLNNVDTWAQECKRLLKDNGTLFWWGHAKKIAYSQIVLDKYFNLENSLVWEKTDCQTRKGADSFRCFPPVTERLLMYSNEILRTGLEEIKLDINNFTNLRRYFQDLQQWIGHTKTKIIEDIGQVADHCFRWGSSQWDLPTSETYQKLIEIYNIHTYPNFRGYESLRLEYESLRLEYESLRRPFNNIKKLTDVMRYSQEVHITKNYIHPTKKTPSITRDILQTCSNTGEALLVPFGGSGTEIIEGLKLGLNTTGFEINPKYHKMICDRVHNDVLCRGCIKTIDLCKNSTCEIFPYRS
jgi:site-specific DNA-methyltransferase (adenine-specific)